MYGGFQRSSSSWASPILLICKKDGTLRICIDYHHLNSVTKLNTFPLPKIDDPLNQLGSAMYFTTLDLAAGYWQISNSLALLTTTGDLSKGLLRL